MVFEEHTHVSRFPCVYVRVGQGPLPVSQLAVAIHVSGHLNPSPKLDFSDFSAIHQHPVMSAA